MPPTIDEKSIGSHALTLYAFARAVGTGTGFVVVVDGVHLLITNYHVLSGCDPNTGVALQGVPARPDRVLVPILQRGAGLVWRPLVQLLLDADGEPLWCGHPQCGARFDVVALPLAIPAGATVIPYPVDSDADIALLPGSELVIIGFPEGMTAAGITAIWKSGTIASELELQINGEDFFWIDSNTRKGMSGSPVIARRFGGALTNSGAFAISGVVDRLLGVYAGRAFDAPDMTLGKVWSWDAVRPIIDEAVSKVLRGVLVPLQAHLGHVPGAAMVNLDVNRSVEVRGLDAAGVAVARTISVGDLLLETTLADERFGVNLERLRIAATLEAAIVAARAGDGNLAIEDPHYALIRQAIEAPAKPYHPVAARQVIPLLDYILAAGNPPQPAVGDQPAAPANG